MEEKEKKTTAEHTHHHHHHHKRSKKNKGKFAKFMHENKRPLIGMAIALALFAALAVVGAVLYAQKPLGDSGNPTTPPVIRTEVQQEELVALGLPYLKEDVRLVDEWVTACVTDPELTPALQILAGYREDGLRLDRGLSAKLRYQATRLPEGCTVQSAQLLVSVDPAFPAQGLRRFDLKADENSKDVNLLKVDTTYYYRFDVTLSDGSVVFVQSSFHTAATPRILSIEGLANVRDIGGWVKAEGKTLRQGLLYRGSEIDDAAGKGYKITSKGLGELQMLGIKTDMDLREHDVAEKGHGVCENWIVYDAPMYVQIFHNTEPMQKIFTDLANADNYPIYLHCTHGKDRTGTVVFLLEAVLGVSEADLIREYELSALYFDMAKDLSTDDIYKVIEWLEDFGGDSLQENAKLYLLSIGITEEQIENLKTIYLG